MFYDLNIRLFASGNVDTSLDPIIQRLSKYGYKGIVIAIETDESIFEKPKKNKEKKKPSDPSNIIPSPPNLSNLKTKFPTICFYSRINIIVSDSSNIRKFIQCKNLKKFDVISFQPENQTVLKTLTGIAEVDIISYNPENKSLLSFNRKLYNQFVNQNVYFELMYSPAILDSTARRNLLSLSHTYKAIGKCKNMIVSSGATAPHHVRAPYDVCNFNLLFGLSEEQSKSSISRNCERLLLRARKQRRNKATIEMVMIQNEESMVIDIPEEKEDL